MNFSYVLYYFRGESSYVKLGSIYLHRVDPFYGWLFILKNTHKHKLVPTQYIQCIYPAQFVFISQDKHWYLKWIDSRIVELNWILFGPDQHRSEVCGNVCGVCDACDLCQNTWNTFDERGMHAALQCSDVYTNNVYDDVSLCLTMLLCHTSQT